MTADTYSGTLGALLMFTGNDPNSWGDNANNAVFQIFEDAIAKVLTEAVTGGTLDLSGSPPPAAASQVRFAAIVFSGVLGSNQTIIVPNLTKFWWIQNTTSGAFTLKIKTSAGVASTAIPQNSGWQLVQCDGANVITVSPFNTKTIQMPDGTVSAPAYSNINELNSGWYRQGAASWRFSILGTDVFTLTSTGAGFPGAAINENRATVASSGTPAIGATAANYILISGTTGITGFDSIAAGAERTLEFQGILTMTNSGTLILQGGSDIQTAAGDVAKFRSEGAGTWRCVSYMRAAQPPPAALANPFAPNMPINLQLSASVPGNLLTIAIKDQAGNDPSVASPVWVPFRNVSLTSGDPVWIKITAALSINTNALGATLASQANVPFRLWVLAFNNGGTPVLALWHSGAGAATVGFNRLDEAALKSTTGISAAATSAGVFYTPNGVTLASKAFRILGYVDYVNGLATPGTYSAAPDVVQLFGPGIKKPGDVVQTTYGATTTPTSVSSTAKVATLLVASLTQTSNCNVNRVMACGNINSPNGGGTSQGVLVTLWRNTGAAQFGSSITLNSPGGAGACGGCFTLLGLDVPSSSSWPPTQYGVYIATTTGTQTWTLNGSNYSTPATISDMIIDEIMA